MFATILGALPRPPDTSNDDDAVREVIALQELAGLDPLTDGAVRWPDAGGLPAAFDDWRVPVTVDAWRFAAACTTRNVKQALPGPFTAARPANAGKPRPAVARHGRWPSRKP